MVRPASPLLDRPFDAVFAAPSHVAVLRALKDCREGMSGRAVARAAGVNHQACALALRRLELLGVVGRQGSGRTQLLRLNFDHYLVSEAILPMFARERALLGRLREEIAARLAPRAAAVTLFGSAARGEAAPGSDVDVLVVALGVGSEALADAARELGATLRARFGLRLSPVVWTGAEVRRRNGRRDSLLRAILRDGRDLGRRRLADLLEP